MMPNLRFWIYANGSYVKLTLRPGETLSYSTGGPTDEGCSYTNGEFSAEDNVITHKCENYSRDCDGTMTTFHESWCHGSQLAQVDLSDIGAPALMPNWQKGEWGQRDYSAEAMNY